MKLATGYLGWSPDVALAADPIVIELAWKGWRQQREELERMMYGAQGIRLPVLPDEDDEGPQIPMATKWRLIARDHNAHWRAKERAKARRLDPVPPSMRKRP